MRFASYEIDGKTGFGAVVEDRVIRLEGRFAPGSDLRALLPAIASGEAVDLDGAAEVALSDVQLLPPVPVPGKILCVATNFHEGKPAPDFPLMFTRVPESLVGHGAALMKPAVSDRYDFEGEMAAIIGRPGHRIARADAIAHVAGFSCFNDGSVRDWQKHSTQFTPGKNFWRSGSFGPWMVDRAELPDPAACALETRVNGVVKQQIGLDRMIFDTAWLIEYISTFTPLAPGDVIVTGTPSGFGATRNPQEFLSPGDVVEVTVTGIGTLSNSVEQDRDPRRLSFSQ